MKDDISRIEEYGFGHESIEHDINTLKRKGDFRHMEMKIISLEDLVHRFVSERTSLSTLFAIYGTALSNFPKEQ